MSLYNTNLVRYQDAYTFEFLAEAPKYSLQGAPYLGVPATKTFEGEPWEVMRENNIVFNFNINAVVPIESVTQYVALAKGSYYYLADGLILPGSVTDDGKRVKAYAAHFLFNTNKFKYSEVERG